MARTPTSPPDDPAGRTHIGAAAADTTVSDEPLPVPTPLSRADRKFRLRAGETVPDGLRRAARGRLAAGSNALATAGDHDERAEAVHDTRKAIKRVRAALRLSRAAVGEPTYRRENDGLRTIAGRLAGARDARVMIDTLGALERRCADEIDPRTLRRLHERLRDDDERASAALAGEGDLAVRTRQSLEEVRARTAGWRLRSDGFDAIKPGLKRVYRQGRKRLRTARDEPTAENLHALRKRVKDLRHAAELLREAHPKRMKRVAKDTHTLATTLGDHHDLSALRDYADANPQLFSDMAARETLLAAIDRRAETLRRRAVKHGRKLYKRSPKRFVKDIGRGWDKRVGAVRV
jgi:CHAD domain-containing protein